MSDNYEGKKEFWNKSSKYNLCLNSVTFKTEEKSENIWKSSSNATNTNNSTLSLYIETYENSRNAGTINRKQNAVSTQKIENTKNFFNISNFNVQNPFEFSRQQKGKTSESEVSQFKSSQHLLNSKNAVMESLNIQTQQVFAGISHIRNSLTWTNNNKFFAFATLSDICMAKAECLENYASNSIIKTLPLNKKPACLAFTKSKSLTKKDVLLVIDGDGRLLEYDVVQGDEEDEINIELIEIGEKSEYPSDFCMGHVFNDSSIISFWCRRNILFCRKRGDSQLYQYKFKADVKCFDSLIYNNSLFCVVGCVNGNVHFFETKLNDLSYFALIGLLTPFLIPVLNVALQALNDVFICIFNHATKVTAVRWEQVQQKPSSNTILKIQRELHFADKIWYMSTDSVISDFTTDIATLKFDSTGTQLLIVTNDRDFGVYKFQEDPENKGEYTWQNLARGGEAKERPFGYCGGSFTASGNRILIYTTKGGFMLFDLIHQSEDFYLAVEAPPPITGHTSAISCGEWDPTGNIFFTSGTRSREIHIIASLKDGTFAQIARPESHQYDIQCLTPLSGLTMIVGSDELPFRIYKASANYCTSLEALTGISANELKKCESELPTVPFFKQPVLGVLNIAANDTEENEDHIDAETVFEKRPTTNQLLRFTYWEVAESLYGHANSASAVCTDAEAKWIATSCHATSPDDAVILIRKVNDWNIHNRLYAHSLTVTKLSFSPNSKYLLSVSRDRSFSIFDVDNELNWTLKNHVAGAHTRMILACSWTPDSNFFVTGGRDSLLSVWPLNSQGVNSRIIAEKLSSPIMALDIIQTKNNWLLAAGLGNGEIHIFLLSHIAEALKLISLGMLQSSNAFSLAVTTLKFRPTTSQIIKDNTYNLAAGSESGIIKVFSIQPQIDC
uniref:Elongator complex protein 2 n=1 Tax=Panagrolaimus sp. PS1159 TaxID=55785 RepID=A0AC35F0N9_9BILA